jgi:hypothetical protein
MINLAFVGMVIAAICTLFFAVRACKARADFDGEAMSRYEIYIAMAVLGLTICILVFRLNKEQTLLSQQTYMIKTTILCNYNDANFIKGPDDKDGYFTSGDNTYMYELDNDIIKITNINNINDTKIIPMVK